jgi:hypothetical protein
MDEDPLSDEQNQLVQEIANRKSTIPETIMHTGGFLGVAGLWGFGMELFSYLKSGVRPNWTMLTALGEHFSKGFQLWLTSPESWLGLHTLVMGMLNADISLVLLLAGMVTYVIGGMFFL